MQSPHTFIALVDAGIQGHCLLFVQSIVFFTVNHLSAFSFRRRLKIPLGDVRFIHLLFA